MVRSVRQPWLALVAIAVGLASVWLLANGNTREPAPPQTTLATTAAVADGALREHAVVAETASGAETTPAPFAPREPASPPAAPRDAPRFPGRTLLHGRVVLPDGSPAKQARVALSTQAVHMVQRGPECAFEAHAKPEDDLVASLHGYEPAVIRRVATQDDVVAGRELVVVLPGPARSIDGWLVRADGTPARDFELILHDGDPIGDLNLPEYTAEDFAAGAVDGRSPERRPDHPNLIRPGADGAFKIRGLRARDYVLRAWNQHTLQTVLSPPVRAGTSGFVFVVPDGDWREHVRGRAIDRFGAGVAGVRVRLTMRVHKTRTGEAYETGQEATTDADGAFAFPRVPCTPLLLRFDGKHVVATNHELAPLAREDVLVRVPRLCRLRCEPGPGEGPRPTSLRVLDAHGKALRLTRELAPGNTESGERLSLRPANGEPEFTVSDEATWVSLEIDGVEAQRLPLRLQPDVVTVVRG